MTQRLKVYGFLTLAAILAAGGYYLNRHYKGGGTAQAKSEKSAQQKKDGEDVIPVELAQATEGPISSFLSSTANLRALRDVVVTSQADGVVKQVLVEEGDFVKEGRLLCRLDDSELQISLKVAEQKLAQALLQLEKATTEKEKSAVQIRNKRAELERNEEALAEGLVSAQEVDALRYQLEELEHDGRIASSQERELTHHVTELKSEIDRVKLQISHTRVTAPFSGHITERVVQLGQTVRNSDRLFRLGDFSPLYADVHLSEQAARLVRPGLKANVTLGTDESGGLEGRVLRISPVVDDSTGTVKVTVELRPSGNLFRPGAFVRVDIETDSRSNAILIPKRALVEEDGESYVFVTEGDTARRQKVTLGYQTDRDVEIREGVSVGEAVVVAGQGNLKEGSKIREIEG